MTASLDAHQRATNKMKPRAIVGSLPVLQYCAPEQLLIDDGYQRSLDTERGQALVRKIAIAWDWGLCQPLFVARRADGGLYVVDGQHRLAAAVLRGDIAQLPCVVTHFAGAAHEAAAFVTLNQQRRPLNALELFKAALAAGDADAQAIQQCVEAAGLALAAHTNNQAMKAGQVANIGGLQRCIATYGATVLETALKVLAGAYPNQVLRYAGSIFPGIVAVVAGEIGNRTAPADLIDRLAPFIGRTAQQDWVMQFAQAHAADLALRRAAAAEKVIRAAWVDYSTAQHGLPRRIADPPAVERHDPGGCAPPVFTAPPTFLEREQSAWCDQCDRRVTGGRAASCTDKFCKMKVPAR
jgi:hypothetical protein